MLRPCVAAVFGLALIGSAAGAETVFRCEAKDGRVTYGDAPCPSDSRASRKLDETPTVSTATGKEAPRSAREAGQIAQSKTGAADALQESRQLDEQIAATRRECADL